MDPNLLIYPSWNEKLTHIRLIQQVLFHVKQRETGNNVKIIQKQTSTIHAKAKNIVT